MAQPSTPPAHTEGESNTSPGRATWQGRHEDAATSALLERDAAVFLHQALSTPCLSAIAKAEGIWIEDTSGRRYMDFHGNSVHHIGYGHPKLKAAIKAQLDELSFAPRRFACEPAVALAEALAGQEPITPDFLIQVLRQGEIALFEALFGKLSGLPAPRLQRVLYDSGGDGLAIACRALDMPKSSFATIFLLSRKKSAGQSIVDPRDLSRTLQLFDRASPEAAKQVVKMWRRDPGYQDAIEQIAAATRPAEDK